MASSSGITVQRIVLRFQDNHKTVIAGMTKIERKFGQTKRRTSAGFGPAAGAAAGLGIGGRGGGALGGLAAGGLLGGVKGGLRKAVGAAAGGYVLYRTAQGAKNIAEAAANYRRTVNEIMFKGADWEKLTEEGRAKWRQKIEARISGVAGRTKYMVQQVTDAMHSGSRAGLTYEQNMKLIGTTTKFAAATNYDLESSTRLLLRMMSSYEYKAKDLPKLAAQMAKSVNKANLTIEELAETIKYVAGPAAGTGLKVPAVLSMIAAFGDIGVTGSMAGTGSRMLMLGIAGAAKGEAKVHFAAIRDYLRQEGKEENLTNFFTILKLGLSKMPRDERIPLIGTMVGTRAATPMIGMLKSNEKVAAFVKKAEMIAETGPEHLDEAYKAIRSHGVAEFENMASAANKANIVAAGVLLDKGRGATVGTTSFFNRLSNWLVQFQDGPPRKIFSRAPNSAYQGMAGESFGPPMTPSEIEKFREARRGAPRVEKKYTLRILGAPKGSTIDPYVRSGDDLDIGLENAEGYFPAYKDIAADAR